MEKGCRRAGPAPVRPTRFVGTAGKGLFSRATVTKISVHVRSEPLFAARQQQRAKAARAQKGKAMDKASVLSGVERAVHVSTCLEDREHLLGYRDLAAIARTGQAVAGLTAALF